jgi:hypothetical protein
MRGKRRDRLQAIVGRIRRCTPKASSTDSITAQREAVTAPPMRICWYSPAPAAARRACWCTASRGWYLQDGFSPHGIMAVTFTNKAAREMRARIEEMVGVSTRGMWVGTFHGLAHRFLKAHWNEAGLPQNFQILDADDQLRVVKRVYRDTGIDEDRFRRAVAVVDQHAQGRGPARGAHRGLRRPILPHDAGDRLPRLRAPPASAAAWSISPSCCCARTSCG